MQALKDLQVHPHRHWIFAGLGAATLLGVYACYKCGCRRKKQVKMDAPKSPAPEIVARQSVFGDGHVKTEDSGDSPEKTDHIPHEEETEAEVKQELPKSESKMVKQDINPCIPCPICEKYNVFRICGSLTPYKTSAQATEESHKAEKVASSSEKTLHPGESKGAEQTPSPSHKPLPSAENHAAEGDKQEVKRVPSSEKSAPGDHVAEKTIPPSDHPAPEGDMEAKTVHSSDKSAPGDHEETKITPSSEHHAPEGDNIASKTASRGGQDEKEAKPYTDCSKYLDRVVHSPPGMVCPPARVGISMFMDTRRVAIHPTVSSNAKTYQRDRWYRGSYYSLPTPSAAFLNASRCPVKPHPQPAKMPKANNSRKGAQGKAC